MNGSMFKMISMMLVLFATAFPLRGMADDSRIFNAKLGCMACHQGDAVPSHEMIKKKVDHSHSKNHIKAITLIH